MVLAMPLMVDGRAEASLAAVLKATMPGHRDGSQLPDEH
jgi:hypothetical protein